MKFDIMWNIENPFQFMKQAREEYYTDNWVLTKENPRKLLFFY